MKYTLFIGLILLYVYHLQFQMHLEDKMNQFDENRIKSALDKFSETAQLARNHAEDILNVISSGFVPTAEQMREFDNDVDNLRGHYDLLLEAAESTLTEEEMPQNRAANDLYNAIHQKYDNLRTKLQKAELLLQKFISVKSTVKQYAEALEPFQKKAKSLLDDIKNERIDTVNNSFVLQNTQLFMTALNADDLDSDKGIEMLESISAKFSPRVQMGIHGKKYYLDQVHPVPPHKKTPEPDNILYPQNEIIPDAPGAKKFESIMKKTPQTTPQIFKDLWAMRTFTTQQALELDKIKAKRSKDLKPKNLSLSVALQTLSRKGLVSSLTVEGQIAYCLTPFTAGCLKKETISLQIFNSKNPPQGSPFICDKEGISKDKLLNQINYNSLLISYLTRVEEGLSDEEWNKVLRMDSENGYYKVPVHYGDSPYSCLLFDNLSPKLPSKNILVVGESVPSALASADFDNLFLFNNGKITKYGEDNDSSGNGTENGTDSTSGTGTTEQPDDPTPADTNSKLPTLDELINGSTTPDDDTFCQIVEEIASGTLNSADVMHDVARATVLARAASLGQKDTKCSRLANRLTLATHYPMEENKYTSDLITGALADSQDKYLKFAIYMQAMITPDSPYDYALHQIVKDGFDNFDSQFPALDFVKPVYNQLLKIHELLPQGGFTPSIMLLLGDAQEKETYIASLRKKAKDKLTIPNINTHMKNLRPLYKNLFGEGSELYDCMTFINNNQVEECNLTKDILKQYCDPNTKDGLSLSDEAIESKVDSEWKKIETKGFSLKYGAKDKVLRELHTRLDLMREWVEHTSASHGVEANVQQIKNLRADIISEIDKASSSTPKKTEGFSGVLNYAFKYIRNYLAGSERTNEGFDDYLYTGVFSIDPFGAPMLDTTTSTVKYYEAWRRALKHISSPIRTSDQAKKAITDDTTSDLFDNLHQFSLLNAKEPSRDINVAIKAAEDQTKKFKEKLEMAYTQGQISEDEKETLAEDMSNNKDRFFEIQDFGCWKQFLTALKRQIVDLTRDKENVLREELKSRKAKLKDGEESALLVEAEMLIEKKKNFAVAEEYFNRFDCGEKEFSDDLYSILNEEGTFANFLSDQVFTPLKEECEKHKGATLKSFAWNFIRHRLPSDWTAGQKDDSQKFIESWPTGKSRSDSMITRLFQGLGLDVTDVEEITSKKGVFFRLKIKATPKGMADYRHPISIFGTQMLPSINVIVLYGNQTTQHLIDTITAMDFGQMSIVLYDQTLDRGLRRQLAGLFHKTSGQNPFILIDRILMLYLATYQKTERLPVLLKCTLPYTAYQPFVRGEGAIADEMFCGRTKELATIIDPGGACVVYGGRQLGKTALLQRAESRCSDPENKKYAIYCNIVDCDNERALVEKITETLSRKTKKYLTTENITSIKELCKQIEKWFSSDKILSLHLLLDEADRFLSSIASSDYMPLQPFVELKRETMNKFKFVLAGLHNVCRAKNATSKNGIFGQLGTPLCIKPLSPTDALRLLSKPLSYLGFSKDSYPHLETVLTNTNYYPGILQFFGYNLVEALRTKYSSYYTTDENPPFTLKDEQLGALMNDADMNRCIKDKFRLSLELDPRYFMLARCIAMLYMLSEDEMSIEKRLGFSVKEIYDFTVNDAKILCLKTCKESDYANLLDEMVEMGILSQPSHEVYRFRRRSFLDIIGRDYNSLLEEIERNNLEEQL